MKLLKKINSQEIVNQIKNQLDIDITKYQNDEVITKIGSLFMIQNYTIGKLIRPIFVGLLLYILFFFILKLGPIGQIIYGIFGFVLFVVTALLFGVVRALNHLKKDLKAIFSYSIETFGHAIGDLTKVSTKVNSFSSNQNSVNLLFEGFIYSVVAPIITKKVAGIPIIDKLVTTGVAYGCNQTIILFKNQNIQLDLNNNNSLNKIMVFANIQQKSFENVIVKTNNAVNKSINTIRFPFKIGFYSLSFILLMFISILFIFN